jgi:polar amino acid transport system permease protein
MNTPFWTPAPSHATPHRRARRRGIAARARRDAQPRSTPAKGDYSHFRVVPAVSGAHGGHRVRGAGHRRVLHSVLTNPRWGWGVFAEWFFAEPVLAGLGRTLLLTALGALFGFLRWAPGWRWRGCRARRCWRGCRGCSPGSSGRCR